MQRGSERGEQGEARSVVTVQALYWLTGYNGLLAAWRGQDGGDGEIGVGGGGGSRETVSYTHLTLPTKIGV